MTALSAPLALADTRGRPLADLRISVMDRCNFRCPYCMPREAYGEDYRFLAREERLGFDEILRLVPLFMRHGVRKVRLTGGEPLLRPNLAELVGELSRLTGLEDLALTTNGVLLRQHASALAANGLRRVTVSLDSLDRQTFREMSGGIGGLGEVLDGIAAAREAGLAPVKVNAVIQRGLNDGQVLELARHFRGSGVILRFIEFMDVGTRNHWAPGRVVPSRELRDTISAAYPLLRLPGNYRGEVAERYAYADGQGEIGFVSSISQPFCGDCSRARLSSEGRLYTCLFAARGLDLRALLRGGASDAEVADAIAGCWRQRADRYSEQRGLARQEHPLRRVEMNYIGG